MNEQNLIKTCGLDEAGRGAWAGPLVAAAVVLNSSIYQIAQLAKTTIKDGKLLDPKKRRRIYQAIKKTGAEIYVEVISTRSINNHGIGWANREIFRRLINKITADKYIIDGSLKIKVRGKSDCIRSVINADATIPEVVLAGIVAKVVRDDLMQTLHYKFPKYNWHRNKGYGTREHQAALIKYNMTYFHRSIFVTTGLRRKNINSLFV